jgi:hypothetical protein
VMYRLKDALLPDGTPNDAMMAAVPR